MEIDSENEHDISDPDEPSSGKIKPLSGKDFQRKLKNTDSKCYETICSYKHRIEFSYFK